MSTKITGKTKTLGLSAPEKLTEEHDFSLFDCNETSINEFAITAHKQAKYRNSVIYVSCEAGTKDVKAYYTLSNGSVIRDEPPKSMQRSSMKEIPVTILGRLGVDKDYQGKGVGLDLLQDALKRSLASADIIGSRAVLVHALDQRLADFYKKHAGFKESTVSPLTLFLAL
jgi:GNAT superfamily N-acetyltransferase